MYKITKTGYPGAARFELKIFLENNETYSIYATKKMYLIEYVKNNLK